MKIVLIGPAGSGKGTIGEMLSEHFNLPQVSLGQTLRDIPESHPWYDLIDKQLKEGVLVDQEKAATILKEELSKDKYKDGFVLDGWFRSMENIRLYFPEVDKFLLLNVSPQESIRRLSSRRTCEKCGDIYNVITRPPTTPGVCDECGGKLVQREDDRPEAIKKRLNIFQNETGEVLKFLKERNMLLQVDGSGTPEEVFQSVLKALE
jgi:adenylate kinase